eukprot:8912022-Alexandrium_andersonii.AAC.1
MSKAPTPCCLIVLLLSASRSEVAALWRVLSARCLYLGGFELKFGESSGEAHISIEINFEYFGIQDSSTNFKSK